MNFTKKFPCPGCDNEEMSGHGGSFGGRITTANLKCHNCGTVLLIVPMRDGYEYSVSAQTEEEIRERYKMKIELKELEEKADNLRLKLRL